jgi:hypothetical protein
MAPDTGTHDTLEAERRELLEALAQALAIRPENPDRTEVCLDLLRHARCRCPRRAPASMAGVS